MTETISAVRARGIGLWRRIQSSPTARRILSGAAWTLAGSSVARLLQMTAVIITARLLGKEVFGAFGIIQGTVGTFGMFAGFSLGLTTNKHIAEFRSKDPEKAGRILALANTIALCTGSVAALALAVSADWLATHFLAAPELGPLLRISSLIVLFDAIGSAQSGTLAGLEAFRRSATTTATAAAIIAPIQVAAVFTWGLQGAVWAYVLGQGLILLLNRWMVGRETRKWNIRPRWTECMRETPILWNFSIPAVLSGLMVIPATWVCNAIIVNGPGGYASMGVYSAALRFTNLVGTLQATLGAALLPMLASSRGNRSPTLDYFNTLYSWVIGLTIIVPLGCFPEIFTLVLGKEFSAPGAYLTFACVLFAGALLAHRQGLGRALAAEGIMWWSVLSNSTWGVLLIGITTLLNGLGHVGRAAADAFAYLITTIIFVPLYVRKRLCPKHLLYSIPAGLAWAATILACFAPIWLGSLWLRGLNFVVCCGLLVAAFRLMWRHRRKIQ